MIHVGVTLVLTCPNPNRMMNKLIKYTVKACLPLALAAQAALAGQAPPADLSKVHHIVVIYLENHSFDNLYGLFPGADGLANAPLSTTRQIDAEGKVYKQLPRVMDTRNKPAEADPRFPADLPNQPFDIGKYAPIDHKTGDLVHRFYQHQAQINGGAMNRFAAVSDAGGLTMGYYDGRNLPLWQYARRYTLADHFFSAAFGGSFINHMWLACACTPRHPNPPAENTIQLDDQGGVIKDGALTTDGYAVNNILSSYTPRSPKAKDPSKVLPPQTQPTLGDRLSDAGISWAWYAGGWNNAVAGQPDPSFQFHHQPYTYFKRYADGSSDRAAHLKDEADLMKAIADGSLPAVAFYKPVGRQNEHPGDANIAEGERQAVKILERIERSPQWPGTVVIVTYDEFGGYWDHVAPPKLDRWGPGSRVPAIIVSPFSLGGRVDHTVYDTTSILKLIEERYGVRPLGERDARANSLSGALDLLR